MKHKKDLPKEVLDALPPKVELVKIQGEINKEVRDEFYQIIEELADKDRDVKDYIEAAIKMFNRSFRKK